MLNERKVVVMDVEDFDKIRDLARHMMEDWGHMTVATRGIHRTDIAAQILTFTRGTVFEYSNLFGDGYVE